MKNLYRITMLSFILLGFALTAAAQDAGGTTPGVIDATWKTSPLTGNIDPEVNPAGIAAFSLTCSETLQVNREAPGFIELWRGSTLLKQIPAQNTQGIYTYREYDKVSQSNSVQINFFYGMSNPASLPGEYKVIIPKMFFNYVSTLGENPQYNPELTFEWTVKNVDTGMTMTPAGGNVNSLKDFTLEFPVGTLIDPIANDKVEMSGVDPETGEAIDLSHYPISFNSTRLGAAIAPEITVEDNVIGFSLPEEYTTPGRYWIYISEGAITYHMGGKEYKNPELTYNYQINLQDFGATVSPTPGTYEYFDQIQAPSGSNGLFIVYLPKFEDGRKWRASRQRPMLSPVDENGEFTTDTKNADVVLLAGDLNGVQTDADGNQYLRIYNPYTINKAFEPAPGNYVLVIPEKLFYYSSDEGTVYAPEIEFFYTVTGAEINCKITPEPGSVLDSIKTVSLEFDEGQEVVLGSQYSSPSATLTNGTVTYLLTGQVDDAAPNKVTFEVDYVSVTAPGTWTFRTPLTAFEVGGRSVVITSEYEVKSVADDIVFNFSPNKGSVDMSLNTRGLASVSISANEPLRVNRDAAGYAELYRDGVLLSQVPAQNSLRFYTWEGYDKHTEMGNVDIVFFESSSNPAMEPGNYTIKLPEGFILVGNDKNNLRYSPASEFGPWVIGESGSFENVCTVYPPMSTAARPKQGNVEMLRELTLTFPEGSQLRWKNEKTVHSGVDEDGNPVSTESWDISIYRGAETYVPEITTDGNVMTLKLPEVLTATGQYYFDVVEGAIEYLQSGSDEWTPCPAIFGFYSIVPNGVTLPISPAPGTYAGLEAFLTFDSSGINPDGSAVEGMEPEPMYAVLDITLPKGNVNVGQGYVYLCPVNENGEYNLDDLSNAVALASKKSSKADENGCYHLWITNPTKREGSVYPVPGDYKLLIPKGRIYVVSSEDGTPTGQLPDLLYDYTFISPDIRYIVSPADESNVEYIKDITITVPNATSLEISGSKVRATLSNDYAQYLLTGRIDPATPTMITFTVDYTTLREPGKWEFCTPKSGFLIDNATPVLTAVYYIGDAPKEEVTYTVSPADGAEMETLSQVRVTCSRRNVVVADKFEAAVTDGTETYPLSVSTVSGGVITLALPEPIEEAGEFTLLIQPGSFVAGTEESPLISASYTLTGKEVKVVPVYTVSPESGSTVQAIEKIIVTCDHSPVEVTSAFDAYLSCDRRTVELELLSNEEGVLTLAPKAGILSSEGEWVLTIAAKSFLAAGEVSEAIHATYTVEGLPYEFACTLDPADGSTVAQIYEVTITFNTDLVERASYSGSLSNGTKAVALNLREINGESVLLRASQKVTEEGVWTLKVAEGSFLLAEEAYNPEITAAYTVSASGVDLISEDGLFTVFTTTGICLFRDGDIDALRALRPGVYIVNGRKVILR